MKFGLAENPLHAIRERFCAKLLEAEVESKRCTEKSGRSNEQGLYNKKSPSYHCGILGFYRGLFSLFNVHTYSHQNFAVFFQACAELA